MSIKKGLGKGLAALIANYDEEGNITDNQYKSTNTSNSFEANLDGLSHINIKDIDPNPDQPRKQFEESALDELASSIKLHGVIQPIILNKHDNRYLIIAGERRYRAARLAGLTTIPAIIREYTNRQIKEISLIENLQREDLNPIEEAIGIRQLMDEFNCTQEIIAERIGKSRSAIANTLRLLSLTPTVIDLVKSNRLSAGHAKAIVVVTDSALQFKFALQAADNKLSVRELEKLVQAFLYPEKTTKVQPAPISIELRALLEAMQRTFATKVKAIGNDHKGRIYIDYYCKDDLDRIHEILGRVNVDEKN